MKKTNLTVEIREEFLSHFLEADYNTRFRTFTDFIWQVVINECYKDLEVCFYVDALQLELIVALKIGGYKKTGIFFKEVKFREAVEVTERLNEKVFNLSKEKANEIITISMFHNSNLI